MIINKSNTSFEAATKCATAISEELNSSKKKNLLLISGGSCFLVVKELSKILNFNNNLTVGLVDERYGVTDSNYINLLTNHKEFIDKINSSGALMLNTEIESKSLLEEKLKYNLLIQNTFDNVKKDEGKIIILLGIGSDCHTAGILPFPPEESENFYELFLDTSNYVVSYYTKGKGQYPARYTLTYFSLLKAYKLFVFAGTDDKQKLIPKIQDLSVSLHNCPASFFTMTDQSVELFTV